MRHRELAVLVVALALQGCSGNGGNKKGTGESCTNNTDCADNVCHAGVCATSAGKALQNGGSCTNRGECKSFICTAGQCLQGSNPADADCLYGEECQSQVCANNKCVAKLKPDSGQDRGRLDGGKKDAGGKDAGSDGAGLCPNLNPLKSDITTPATLTGCYLVDRVISVSSVLTIAPGSVLVFKKDAGLDIGTAGTLKAVGTSTQKILFTGEQKTRGYWKGIQLVNTNAPDNAIQHAVVEYGGSASAAYGQKANLALTSSGSPVGAAISDCVLRESGGYGFFLADQATVPSFANNTVTLNTAGAGYVYDDAAGQLDKTTSYKGNTVDMVWVEVDKLTKSRTWPAIDVRYVVHGILTVSGSPGVILSIEAGATLAFLISSGIEVLGEGALTAKGTVAAPITFTQASTSDKWRGLHFVGANSGDNILDHVVVEHAGSSSAPYGQKAAVAATSSGGPVRLTLTNSILRQSDGYGFYLSRNATIPSFAGNTVTQNTLGAGYVQDDAAGQLDKSTTYKGNTVDMVWVAASDLTKSQTWPALDVRYVVQGTLTVSQSPGILLTIEAGAILAFRLDSGIDVGVNGGLAAKGTAAAPITFTRATNDAWRGLTIASNTTENILDHALVEYAGSVTHPYGGKADVGLTSSGYAVRLTLTNSTLKNSAGYGVWVSKFGTLTQSGNTFSGNALSPDIFYQP